MAYLKLVLPVLLVGLLPLIQAQLVFKSDLKADPRIIGGSVVTNRTEFAYQVSIRVRSTVIPGGSHICGGSLISARFVLGAGQCVILTCNVQNVAANLIVVAGSLTLSEDANTVYRDVSRVILHPDYNLLNGRHDAAIFELAEELFLNNITIAVVPLSIAAPEIGTNCTVAGWGVTQWGGAFLSDELRSTQVGIAHGDECRSTFNTTWVRFREDMLCAGGQSTCEGDAGGALVCDGKQVGIVSFNQQCGVNNTPTVFADIAYFVPWITNETGIQFDSAAGKSALNVLLVVGVLSALIKLN